MDEPERTSEDWSIKLCIEIVELAESYKSHPTPDLLERIKLKEQLLNELRELLATKKK
jgi:hypothetical protein